MFSLRLGSAALALSLAMLTAPAQAQNADENPVVARVNGEEIRLERVMAMIQDLPPQYRQAPIDQLYPALVRRAVNNVLMAEAAAKTDIAESDRLKEEVEAYRQSKILELYLIRTIEQQTGEDVLRARYDEFVKTSEPDPSVHARHILVKEEAEAKAIIKELDGGADFMELAKAKSVGPSGPQGGDLGFFKAGQMVPAFEEAAFAMDPGTYSKAPVQSRFGWHIIKVEARNDFPAFEEKADELRQQMSGEILTKLVEGLREGASIEEFKIDGSPLEEPAKQE